MEDVPINKTKVNHTKWGFVIIFSSLIISISFFLSCYLIALGNRYIKLGDSTFLYDKWTNTVFSLDGKKSWKLKNRDTISIPNPERF